MKFSSNEIRRTLLRLASTIRNDILLQIRNGFYYVVAFVLVLWAIVLILIPRIDFGYLLPGLLMGNMTINTFYFIGGLVLLEKDEGSLQAQIVTPLRTWEYLASKITSLLLLTLVENIILVALCYGFGFRLIPLVAAIITTGAIYCLVGFVAVARYASINEYLFPSIFYTSVFTVPLVGYFGLADSWLFYLHPMQAPLILFQAAFHPVTVWQLIYALLYSVFWIWMTYRMSRTAFFRYIIAREGVR